MHELLSGMYVWSAQYMWPASTNNQEWGACTRRHLQFVCGGKARDMDRMAVPCLRKAQPSELLTSDASAALEGLSRQAQCP